MSSIGQPCERKLWYEVNKPELAEGFTASTLLKFSYGNLLEELLIFLAEEAGHTVTGRQDTLDIAGIKGHRDAVCDGVTLDTKSASSFSFLKFQTGLKPEDDAFGYLTQLRSYVLAAKDDPLVTDKARGAFLVIDKTAGHLCLDIHTFDTKFDIETEFERKKALVLGDRPKRGYTDEAFGASGNRKLGVNCSYCAFKTKCWPALRTFAYSTGPVFLTEVKLLPKVFEVKGPVAEILEISE